MLALVTTPSAEQSQIVVRPCTSPTSAPVYCPLPFTETPSRWMSVSAASLTAPKRPV